MKNTSGETQKATSYDSAWDSLKNIEFAGEKQKPNFSEKYINDFGRETLRNVLGNKEILKTVENDYLGQYEPNSKSKAKNIAGKESLDHFVMERLSSDNPEMFIQSQEFKNYAEYITKIADSKVFESKNKKARLYPEYYTNPILKDKKMRELVLKTAYPNSDLAEMNNWIEQQNTNYKDTIEYFVEDGIKKRQKLSQLQMDIVGDYVYSSKDFENGVAKAYAEYCFNEIRPDYDLKPSTPMLGALANYFASQYTIDEDVKKNSRFIIANQVQKQGDLRIGKSTEFGCVLEQNHFTEMSLITDNSLNKSRTDRDNDLYRFMMISFHELTHDHQRNSVKRGEKSSSAMMYIMRDILNRGSGCYVGKDKDGSEKRGRYYDANHDNDEIEIQADEEAWRQCRTFLVAHQKEYAWRYKDEELEKKHSERRIKCKNNEEEVRARRTFTKKYTNAKEEVSAIKYDVETLQSTIKTNPELLKTYPQLAGYIDASGNLNSAIFIGSKIAKQEREGFDSRDDVFGAELGTYMLTDDREAKKLIGFIRENGESFSGSEAKNLISNLYNIVHQTVEKNRALKDINFNNYDETHARGKDFDMEEKKTSILRQYLVQSYNAIWAAEALKSSHPELTERLAREEDAYIGSYYQQLSSGAKLDSDFVKKVIERYTRTNNPTLTKMAKQMKSDYGL